MSNKVSIPRIRNVRLKGASNVTVLRAPQANPDRDLMLDHGRALAHWAPPGKVAGWHFIVWDENGRYNQAYRFDPQKSPIGNTLAPSFVADALRRSIIEDGGWK